MSNRFTITEQRLKPDPELLYRPDALIELDDHTRVRVIPPLKDGMILTTACKRIPWTRVTAIHVTDSRPADNQAHDWAGWHCDPANGWIMRTDDGLTPATPTQSELNAGLGDPVDVHWTWGDYDVDVPQAGGMLHIRAHVTDQVSLDNVLRDDGSAEILHGDDEITIIHDGDPIPDDARALRTHRLDAKAPSLWQDTGDTLYRYRDGAWTWLDDDGAWRNGRPDIEDVLDGSMRFVKWE